MIQRVLFINAKHMQPIKDWHLVLIVVVMVLIDSLIAVTVLPLDNARLSPLLIPDKQDKGVTRNVRVSTGEYRMYSFSLSHTPLVVINRVKVSGRSQWCQDALHPLSPTGWEFSLAIRSSSRLLVCS